MSYQHDLDGFTGVPERLYGFTDEFNNLRQLIQDTGIMVKEAEYEFRQVLLNHPDDEGGPSPNPEQLKVWHKKMYRRFTYKSLLMLIHSTFETQIIDFLNLMIRHKQISRTTKGDNMPTIFSELDKVANEASEHYKKIRPFSFLRNKTGHLDGIFHQNDSNANEFIKFANKQSGLSLTKLSHDILNPQYRIIIINSSILINYINLAEDICNKLVTAARTKQAIT
ncbi:hypothetical protein HNQ91_000688 [Filimonas zeae]|nr:hypothetical protein [Filimonas zeae]MDR6337666.1 hypothetical protein [Filimonas zeae]